ncbi:hypothetical protein GCM10009808_20240 [Microbacterium sediminicola]|uniref:ABC transporter domain-containing protein n=1 Tax=Microbacterium sediminicola TaxID=415210 RepID=A0ABP4UCL1_9MICO
MSVMELRRATRRFRTGAGVADLSLVVDAGQIVALVGLNGAGKTTLQRMLLGMLRPDAGDVLWDGIPRARTTTASWRTVGHVIETPLAYGELTVTQNLRLAARLRGAPVEVVETALERFRLRPLAGRRVRQLSLGNRQRVGLAAALMHAPNHVILDEPTNALDPAGVLLLRDVLLERRAAGAAILVSSHHLDEVARIADRVVLMNAGRLIGELDPQVTDIEHVFFERIRLDDEAREEPA